MPRFTVLTIKRIMLIYEHSDTFGDTTNMGELSITNKIIRQPLFWREYRKRQRRSNTRAYQGINGIKQENPFVHRSISEATLAVVNQPQPL
jgi:hypothetical protein